MPLFKSESEKKPVQKPRKADVLASLDAGDRDFDGKGGGSAAPKERSEFERLFQASLDQEFTAGAIVKGRIIGAKGDFVVVDISYKSEGLIPKSEFRMAKGEEEIEPGREIDVCIERIEDEKGMVALSKDKADIKKAWRDITRAVENNETVRGKVIALVKGGLSVDIGVKAFLPGSQMDTYPIRSLEAYVGNEYDFKVIKVNHRRGNIVLSRRALLEKERENFPGLESFKKGSVVKGLVKNLTEYGAFVDLGGIDGLLHVTDMSWSRVERPSDILQVGQTIDVKILKCDPEKNRIGLGIKQLNEAKWEEAAARYKIGEIVKGRVTSLVDYGAFVALEDGLEGLVHVHEISWTRKAQNPRQTLSAGDEVQVKILDILKESRKISLSIKQAGPSPWTQIMETYSVGQVVELPIVSISDFGLFVKVSDNIDGLIHVSDLSWTENIKPFETFKPGDMVKAKILDINPEDEKFSLGLKQLRENPWETAEERFPVGSRHEVEAVNIVDFGVFVRIQNDIEGLIHISELSRERIKHPSDVIKLGDKVQAEIINIDKDSKKIGLSIRLIDSEPSRPEEPAGEAGKSGESKGDSDQKQLGRSSSSESQAGAGAAAGGPQAREESEKEKPQGAPPKTSEKAAKPGGLMDNIFAKALKKSIKEDKEAAAPQPEEKPAESKPAAAPQPEEKPAESKPAAAPQPEEKPEKKENGEN